MDEKIKVLMVEDTPQDATLILYALKRYGFQVQSERVQDAACMNELLKKDTWDVVLCDYTMPQFSGEVALDILNRSGLDIPFILVSGHVGEETAVSMMKSGASDFVMKDNLARLPSAVAREVREANIRQKRRQAETELVSQRILMKTILDQAAEAITVSDHKGQVIFANPAALRLARQPDLDSLQSSAAWGTETDLDGKAIPEDDWAIPRALRGEVMAGQEARMHRVDGSTYDVLINGAPLRDPDGNTVGTVCVLTDFTHLRKVEEQQRQYAAELERSNRELKEFASIASHDLKEPLRKVKVFSDLLLKTYHDSLGEDGQNYLMRMVNASHRMEEMINDLLTYSRISARENPFSQVQLLKTARDVLSDLEVLVAQTHGTVELGDLPAIEANPLQMRQLFQNLISNALKFHHRDIPPRVKVWAETVPGAGAKKSLVRLHVKDNGIGFNENHLDRIFQPFQRLHGRNEFEGTGMGLAICHKIVDRHNGTITATSQPGVGSTFTVTLPSVQPFLKEIHTHD